jgi:hypothetical protein
MTNGWNLLLDEFELTGTIAPPQVEVFEPEIPYQPHCCTDCGCVCGGCE